MFSVLRQAHQYEKPYVWFHDDQASSPGAQNENETSQKAAPPTESFSIEGAGFFSPLADP